MKEMSLTRLGINGVEYYAYHGVKPEERKLGGKYQVSMDLFYDATAAVLNDDVNFALNYEEAIFCISEVIANEQFALVETIVFEILNSVMEKFPMLVKATVKVRKYVVPIRRVVDFIEVEQSLTRSK